MKINVVAGFLGAGKTTLIRRTLDQGLPGERVAVLLNEFDPIGLDGEILRRGAVEMVQLASGCICCTLRGELAAAVRQIAGAIRPDRLLIECTGIADPTDVVRTSASALADVEAPYHLCPTLTLVDTPRFLELLPRLGHLLEPQVRGADVIVLNKLDRCPDSMLQDVRKKVRELNAVAPLEATTYAQVDLPVLDDWPVGAEGQPRAARASGREDRSGAGEGGAGHGVSAWAFTDPGIFAQEALHALLAALPDTLLRLKGCVNLTAGPSFLNAVPGDWQLEPLPGPRANALVCIGLPDAREQLTAALRRCIINHP